MAASPSMHPASAAAVAFVALVGASPAAADVYKCAGEGRTPIYQETPCPPGKELRNFQVDPPEITVLPATPMGAAAAPPPPPKAKAAPAPNHKPDRPDAVRAVKPRGDPAERRHLHAGMSEGEVLARVGAPDTTSGAKSAREVRWSWLPAEGDPEMLTTVTLLNGVVTDVYRRLIKK